MTEQRTELQGIPELTDVPITDPNTIAPVPVIDRLHSDFSEIPIEDTPQLTAEERQQAKPSDHNHRDGTLREWRYWREDWRCARPAVTCQGCRTHYERDEYAPTMIFDGYTLRACSGCDTE